MAFRGNCVSVLGYHFDGPRENIFTAASKLVSDRLVGCHELDSLVGSNWQRMGNAISPVWKTHLSSSCLESSCGN